MWYKVTCRELPEGAALSSISSIWRSLRTPQDSMILPMHNIRIPRCIYSMLPLRRNPSSSTFLCSRKFVRRLKVFAKPGCNAEAEATAALRNFKQIHEASTNPHPRLGEDAKMLERLQGSIYRLRRESAVPTTKRIVFVHLRQREEGEILRIPLRNSRSTQKGHLELLAIPIEWRKAGFFPSSQTHVELRYMQLKSAAKVIDKPIIRIETS